MGAFIVMGLVVIFVRAGQFGHATGGQQSAEILNAAGSGAANWTRALEGE